MLLTFRRHCSRRAGWLPVMVSLAVMYVAVVARTSAQTAVKKSLLDLADEAFSRTEGTAARKATKFRDEYAAMVESIVAASEIGEAPEADRVGSTAIERLRRASLPAGTHRGKDGTLIEVSRDGIARFTTPDKRIATVLPGGRRFYQPAQNSPLIAVDHGSSAVANIVGDPPPLPESYIRVKSAIFDKASGSEDSPPNPRSMKPEEYRLVLDHLDGMIRHSLTQEREAARNGDQEALEESRNITDELIGRMQRIARDRSRLQRGGLDPEDQQREDFLDELHEVRRRWDRLREQRRQADQREDSEEIARIDDEINDVEREEFQIVRERENRQEGGRVSGGQVRPGQPVPRDDRPHVDPQDRTRPAPAGGSADADESVARPDRFGTDRVHRLLDEPGEHATGLPWSNLAEAANAAGGGDESVASEAGGDDGAGREGSEIVLRNESPGRGDDVVSSSRIPGTGIDVFVRENGAVQIRLPGGTVVTSQPDLGYVGVTDPQGQEGAVARRDDGLVQVGEGALGMAIDLDTGRAFILNEASGGSSGAGQRIVVEPSGAYAYTDSESSFQAVRPDNSLDQAGYVDANTGATVRYDADTGETRIYTPEGVVAGISNGSSGVFVNPASGGQLPVGGVLEPPAASGNPAAVSIWSTAQAEPPSQAPRRFPSSAELASQYIATARDMIARNADEARRQGIPQEEIDRIRRELATMETETLVARDLQRLQRIAEARAGDFAAGVDDPALAAIDSQIAAAEAALEKARSEARAKQDELSKAREEAVTAIREANETVAQGERNLQLFIATNDPSLEKAELASLEPRVAGAVQAARQAAEGTIDTRKYDRCPNGNSWETCGNIDQKTGVDHDAIKRQWWREQLASAMTRAMGPALVAQEKRVEALKKAIAEKEKTIDQEKKLQQVAKEQAERVLQQQQQKEQQLAEQLKAAEKASDQDIRAKDEALFNLKQKRIEISLRPRRPKSDLQEFSDQVFGGTAFGSAPSQGP